MKNLVLSFFTVMLSLLSYSQIETPRPSPFCKIEQKVGLTDVTIEYSRPSMKGRAIFGDLVPYGKLWRLGANANTTITFSDDVMIGGKEVKAGSYAIFATPNKDSWEVVFYNDTNNWGIPKKWDDSKVVAKVNQKTYTSPTTVESFSIGIDNLSNAGATLGITWENVYVGVEFQVPTDKKVSSAINKVMSGPSANDYYAAAVYYSSEGKDINQAQKWMEKAMSMTEKPAFWQLRQQSLIYAKAGNKKAAIQTAKKSLAGAEAAGNSDYIKMNKDSLKEWKSM